MRRKAIIIFFWFALIMGIIFSIVTVKNVEKEDWQKYAEQHHCKPIGEIRLIRERNKILYNCDNWMVAK